MKVVSVKEIVDADLCTGCGLCETISGHHQIEMKINQAGFYRPQVHQSNSEAWKYINQTCPGIAIEQDKNLNAHDLNKLWGPISSALVGYSTNETIRWQASSGGALSALLIYLLETNKIDYVLHIGVDKNDPFQTIMCKSCTREQVLANAGSRYAPTAPLADLNELLTEEARFAFVGKPCDVAALRAYTELEPHVGQKIVAFFSFFCAGIPSMLATFDLVNRLGLNKNDVKEFRYRGFGWPGRATAIDTQGRQYSMNYQDSWGEILGPRLQFRCKICPDGVGEMADIVCGDAWHIKNGHPDFEELPGESIILARTPYGQQLLKQAELAGYLNTAEFDLKNLAAIQPSQKNRRRAVIPRLLALILARRPFPQYKGFYLLKNAWNAGPWLFIRNFGGMLRRLVLKKFQD